MKPLRWVLVWVLACGLAGCGLPGGARGEEEEAAGLPTVAPGLPEPVEDSPEGMDLAECPPGGALTLKFSANFTMQEGEFSMTHTLQDGLLSLMLWDASYWTWQVQVALFVVLAAVCVWARWRRPPPAGCRRCLPASNSSAHRWISPSSPNRPAS